MADGANPNSPPTIDAAGDLLGSTGSGGQHNLGTVYKLTIDGDKPKITTLYSFCALTNCNDGEGPSGKLALASNGDIYGATFTGGVNSRGILYKISGGNFTKLYDFCPEDPEKHCPSGGFPNPILLDSDGSIFGTADFGGRGQAGLFYSFKP